MFNLSAHKNSFALYFICALGWSWLFWIPAVVLGYEQSDPIGMTLFILGGLGPALATLFLLFAANDRETRSAFWTSMIDIRRMGLKWTLVTLLTVPLAGLLAILSANILGGLDGWEPVRELVYNPVNLVLFTIANLFFGPLPEEIGWRGYALPRLQKHFSSLAASLILGAIWVIWHLPLFFIKNSPFAAAYAVGSLNFWAWMLGLLAASVIMTWLFNTTHGSILSSILFHLALNVTSGILLLPPQAQIFMLVWLAVIAVLVVASRGKNLGALL
jgi:membrane protease YdiL (CAAX protease family)